MRQEAFVNPDLLIWARESINMDIDHAAKKIGVKSDRVREWEAGEQRPTVSQARKMSQVYRRPMAAFFLPQRPTSMGFSVPHDFRRLPKNQPRVLNPELIAELRRIEYLREAAIELAEETPQEPEKFIGKTRVNTPISQVAHQAIELLQLPLTARQKWHSDYDAFNGWKNAIENQGVLVMHLNNVEVAEVRGIAIAQKFFPLIAINGKDSPNGRIFTLLHEFIHLMLGATGMSNMRISRRPHNREQRIEQFCNHIAGEILIPEHELLQHEIVRSADGTADWPDEAIHDLARYFKVSREVVVRRLLILGKTTDRFYRMKRQQYGQEASRKPTGGPIPMSRKILRAIGQPFARIALDAYHREAISSSDLAELLGARLKHLSAVEDLLASRSPLAGDGNR